MTEQELLDEIVRHAKACGWRVAHFRPAQTRHGWRTAMQGDVGYPDLTMVHELRKRLVFVELKSAKGELGPGQSEWLTALRHAGAEGYVWRPADLPQAMSVIYGRPVVT